MIREIHSRSLSFGLAFCARTARPRVARRAGTARWSAQSVGGARPRRVAHGPQLRRGNQVGDAPPNGDSGSGTVVAGGMAVCLPSSALFGFTFNADVMKSITGSLRAAPGQPGSAYRPTLITLGIGVSLAGSAK